MDKLKEEDIERQLRMAIKKRELKELKNENREKYEEDNKEEKCEEEDKDTETINKGGQSKKHKEEVRNDLFSYTSSLNEDLIKTSFTFSVVNMLHFYRTIFVLLQV